MALVAEIVGYVMMVGQEEARSVTMVMMVG
jgi:hypothetical protein